MSGASDQPWRCGYCQRQATHCRRRGSSPVCDGCREHLEARGKRFCAGCRQALPLDRFAVIGGTDGKRRGTCRRCRQPLATAAVQRWRKRYPERNRAYRAAYASRRPDVISEQRRRWYANRKVKIWRGVRR